MHYWCVFEVVIVCGLIDIAAGFPRESVQHFTCCLELPSSLQLNCALFSILLREVEGSIEPSSLISYFSRLLVLLPSRSRRTLVSADALEHIFRSNSN